MKTVIIWDQLGQDRIKYAILDGDYKHLDEVFINDSKGDEEKMSELYEIFYNEEGENRAGLQEDFPISIVKNEECAVITAGFFP